MAFVSVIIPTYNRCSVLNRAIQSVLSQSFEDYELILVDDGSDDGTSEIIKSHSKNPRVRAFRMSNQGVSAARNLGVSHSRGQWLAFLDSDDEWLPEKLGKQVDFIRDNPSIKIIHGEEIWIRKGVRVNPMKKHKKKGGDIFSEALRFCCMSPSTIMIKRDLFLQRGSFDETFPVCEDYDLWLRLCFDQKVGFITDFLIKKYGGHKDQLSSRFHSMDYWRIKALKKVLEFPLSGIQAEKVIYEMKKKRKILLKGYRKHQNLSNFDEIFFSPSE